MKTIILIVLAFYFNLISQLVNAETQSEKVFTIIAFSGVFRLPSGFSLDTTRMNDDEVIIDVSRIPGSSGKVPMIASFIFGKYNEKATKLIATSKKITSCYGFHQAYFRIHNNIKDTYLILMHDDKLVIKLVIVNLEDITNIFDDFMKKNNDPLGSCLDINSLKNLEPLTKIKNQTKLGSK